jgi:hypothetical protein
VNLHENDSDYLFVASKYYYSNEPRKFNVFMSVGRIYIYNVCNIVSFYNLERKLQYFKEKSHHVVDYLEECGRNYIIVGIMDDISQRKVEYEKAY